MIDSGKPRLGKGTLVGEGTLGVWGSGVSPFKFIKRELPPGPRGYRYCKTRSAKGAEKGASPKKGGASPPLPPRFPPRFPRVKSHPVPVLDPQCRL